MKLSKIIHILSVIAGIAGIVYFIALLINSVTGSNEFVFGITKVDALLCIIVLFLIAIWLQIAAIHHMMLEKKGQIV